MKELVAVEVGVGVPVRVQVQVALGVAVKDGVEVEVRVQVYPVVGFWQGGTLVKVAVAAGAGLVGVESPLFLQAVGRIATAMTSKTQDNFRMFPPIFSRTAEMNFTPDEAMKPANFKDRIAGVTVYQKLFFGQILNPTVTIGAAYPNPANTH